MKLLKLIICGITFILFSGGYSVISQAEQKNTVPFAKPVDPIDTIIEAFKTYNVVALDEGHHTNIPGHEFRLALLRDPRFPEVVNDIVVECGNSLYQDIMDRFTNGEEVTYDELRPVWEKTTATNGIWSRPIYYEFFCAVRDLNATLPADRRIRVLLGDPPVDRENQSDEEYNQLEMQRDSYPVALIEREVIAKSRRALIVYGGMHLIRKGAHGLISNPIFKKYMINEDQKPSNIVGILESKDIKVFVIWWSPNDKLIQLQPNIASWKIPSLAFVKNTVLGLAPLTTFHSNNTTITRTIITKLKTGEEKVETIEEIVGADPERSGLIQEGFDAILVFGPSKSIKLSR